ncbi:sensor histidine kinase [Phytoactinopolyspora halophila]|nr:HAMP domain-containing sensor histidine kinase [Phytoactinopolyspora halophila]
MFWELVLGASLLTVAICLTKLLLVKTHIRRFRGQLERLREDDTREIVKISLVDRELERLAVEVNEVITHLRQLHIDAKNNEHDLKIQIANMSHDLKTPLVAVKGYVQLLQRDRVSPDEASGYLQIIAEKADVLSRLVGNFFELSIIDSDDYQVDVGKLDINASLTNVALTFYTSFAERDIEPEMDLPDRAVYAWANDIAFERIMHNLIENAILYTEGKIWLSLNDRGHSVVVTVSNEITNPSALDPDQLFKRSYRADQARHSSHSGLGLYIVKTLAEKMNATVRANLSDGFFSISIILTSDT